MVTHHNSIQLVHGHTPQFHLASSWSHTTILFSQFMVRPQFHLASSQSHTTIPFSQVMVTHHNSIQAKHMSFRLYRSFPNDNVVTHIILFSISWLIVTHHNSIQLGHGHTPQFYLASSWSDRNSMQLVHGHTQFHLASSWSHTTIPCSQFMVTHHNSIQLVHGRKPQFHLASSWSQTTIPFSQFMVTNHNSIQLVHGHKPQFHLASSWSQTTIPFNQFMVTNHNSIQLVHGHTPQFHLGKACQFQTESLLSSWQCCNAHNFIQSFLYVPFYVFQQGTDMFLFLSTVPWQHMWSFLKVA